MKQKRLVSMIGMLVVLFCTLFMMTGCPQANGNKDKKENTAISYTGDYVGKGENYSGIGNWEFSISSSGKLSGWFQILSEEKAECSGSIKSDGSFTGTGKINLAGLPFTITGKIANSKVSGKLKVEGLHSGSFLGNKK